MWREAGIPGARGMLSLEGGCSRRQSVVMVRRVGTVLQACGLRCVLRSDDALESSGSSKLPRGTRDGLGWAKPVSEAR